jgi:NADPH oxidase
MDDKKEEEMYRNTVTRWGLYGRNMVILNSFGLFGAGIFSIAVWSEGRAVGIRISPLFLGVFILAIVVGLLSMIVELLSQGTTPAQSRAKAVAYTFLALPFLITFFTIFHSVLYLIAVVCFIRSIMLNEYVKPPPKAKAEASKMEMKCESPCYQISKSRGWGLFVFRVLFVGGNVATIVVTYLDWYGRVNRRRVPVLTTAQSVFDSMFPFTFYLPTARVGGSGMNIAYSLILLPVSRTFLRQLYDFSTQNQGIIAKFVRSILWIFPLDKALHFHEKIAYLGLFYAFVHSFAHLVNASLAWDQVVIFYGWSPLISGFVLWVLIYLLYPATPRNTKSGHFELFWYSHQVLWVFFALCIIHGRDTIGPNYWRYIIVPGSIYVLERLYRLFSAYQTVPLISVTNMQNKVLSIEFDKCVFPGGYKEGQYLFLQCPAVSRGQWHPFTISSAPDDPTVTLHIKVGGPKTWTRQVLDYLVLYGPKNASYFELAETSPGGVKLGKTIGPKGERILRVYGPHAAPTEHCPEYQVDIIVGSGIGVTPVSSTMQEILYHRWRFNVGYSFPDHAYFCWVCAHAEIESFRWMIRIVKEAQDQMNELRLKNEYLINGKTFEVHIWVTSKPDDYTLKSYKIEDEDGFWGRRRHRDFNVEKLPSVFEEVDLMNLMLDPPKGPPTILGDIRVYNGRPKWDTIFEQVARRHPGISCGVCFCGNPRIADDLGHMCVKHTVPEKRQIFVLHKENF